MKFATSKISIDNLIFFRNKIGLRMGGPSGYLANLKQGFLNKNCENIIFVETHSQDTNTNNISYKLIKFFINFVPTRKNRKILREKLNNKILKELLYKELDFYNIKTITTHLVDDTLFIRKYIKTRKLKTRIITMSHSPELPSEETYYLEKIYDPINAESNFVKNKEKEYEAFNTADIFIFPSKESTEPYLNSADYFRKILNTKPVYYINTGCVPLKCSKTKQELRTLFNIKTPYVISYIGRHNLIKGYDNLKIIASNILQQRNDITFLIGGKESEIIEPLKHQNWIELGIVNPADVIEVSDLFILPNRQTYFDLILLEILSMGIPVLATNTGGNKSVYNTTKCIELYDSLEECIQKIFNFLNKSEKEKIALSKKIRNAYLNNYTIDIFAKNYKNIINEICKNI